MVDTSELKALDIQAMGQFRDGRYAEALPLFLGYLDMAAAEGRPSSEYEPRFRKNIAECQWALLQKKSDLVTPQNFSENLTAYLAATAQADVKTIAPPPLREYFRLVIRFNLFVNQNDMVTLKTHVSRYYQAFLDVAQGKVTASEFLQDWIQEVNNERFNFSGDERRTDRAIALAEGLLEILQNQPTYRAERIEACKLLADLHYFKGDEDSTDESKHGEVVLNYLNILDKEDSQNHFSKQLRSRIHKQRNASLQIRRFKHDTNSRLGNMKTAMAMLKKQIAGEAILTGHLERLETEISRLNASKRLALHEKPAGSEFKKVDLAELLMPLLDTYQWPHAVIQPRTAPQPWSMLADYVVIVLENLLKNSVEAYSRQKRALPELPCHFVIDDARKLLICRDFAGGIDPNMGDIFEPYKTSKGVQQEAGLGLGNAREAMELQGFSLTIAAEQPADGACFVLDFNRQPRSQRTPFHLNLGV